MSIYLHLGPMFASKSALLIRKAEEDMASRQVLVYSFTGDVIASRAIEQPLGCTYLPETDAAKIIFDALAAAKTGRPVSVFIDEVQFAPSDLAIVAHVMTLLEEDYDIETYLFGLDCDYTGKEFDLISRLRPHARYNHYHYSVCAVCREPNATMSQRLIDGAPAPHDGPLIALDSAHCGENEYTYEPRCKTCYETA